MLRFDTPSSCFQEQASSIAIRAPRSMHGRVSPPASIHRILVTRQRQADSQPIRPATRPVDTRSLFRPCCGRQHKIFCVAANVTLSTLIKPVLRDGKATRQARKLATANADFYPQVQGQSIFDQADNAVCTE